jgi:hypothetical protein
VVALDEPLGFAVEVVRRDQEIVRSEAVYPRQAGNDAHAAPGRLLEKLLGGHREAGGEGHGRGRAAGQQCIEKVPGGGARVAAVLVFEFLGEDPGLYPVEQLIAEHAKDAELREVDVAVDEPGKDQAILEVRHLQVGVTPGEVGEVAEVIDDAVPDDQEAVADKARGPVLMAGVLPRVVHEIEEAAADGATDRHQMSPRHPVRNGNAKGSDRRVVTTP